MYDTNSSLMLDYNNHFKKILLALFILNIFGCSQNYNSESFPYKFKAEIEQHLESSTEPWKNSFATWDYANIGEYTPGLKTLDEDVAKAMNRIRKGDEEGIAAKLCRNIGPDWFLPSISELNLMHTNLNENGHGGFTANRYWSSSEYNLSLTWFREFDDIFPGAALKNIGHHVRAIRAF